MNLIVISLIVLSILVIYVIYSQQTLKAEISECEINRRAEEQWENILRQSESMSKKN